MVIYPGMTIVRCQNNPIISPEQLKPSRADYEVICAFNAGVARYGDEIILLLRVAERPINTDPSTYLAPVYDPITRELISVPFGTNDPAVDLSDSRLIITPRGTWLTSISHLRVARSSDRVTFVVEQQPALFPANQYESFGIEDCRITQIDAIYYVSYTAVSPLGVTTFLARTRDFHCFERLGNIFHPDNKDVAIFPERIGGKYYALHRPATAFGKRADMWIAESPDLLCWGNHRHLLSARAGYWDDLKLGASCVPFRADLGWIELYHGVGKDNLYSVGAVLLDLEQPWRVLKRSRRPVLSPEAAYENAGFWGRVIFPCGCLYERGTVTLYYGAADRCTCMAELSLDDILETLD
jgi:predicted GH43/DUF377 family glycosyl hydrolase